MSTSLPRPISRMSQAMIVLGLCAALVVAFVNLREMTPVRMVEGKLLTARFLLRGPIPADPNIILLQTRAGDAPGTDDLTAAVNKLADIGARSLVIDPALLTMEKAGGDPADAKAPLIQALKDYGRAAVPYLFYITADANEANGPLPGFLRNQSLPASLPKKGAARIRPLLAEGYGSPRTGFLESGTPGFVLDAAIDTEKGRFAYPVARYDRSFYPSLPLAAARIDQDLPFDAVSVIAGEGINIGNRFIPTDPEMRIAVNFHGPNVYPAYAFTDFLSGKVAADIFKNKLVILGNGQPMPSLASPYDAELSRAAWFANVTDNLIHADPLERSQQVVVLDIILLGLIGLIFAGIAAARKIPMVLLFAIVAAALVFAANVQAFILLNLWLGLTFPLLAILLCTLVLVFTKALSERRLRALATQSEAEAEKFAAPWTFDRVAKREAAAVSSGPEEEHTPSLPDADEAVETAALVLDPAAEAEKKPAGEKKKEEESGSNPLCDDSPDSKEKEVDKATASPAGNIVTPVLPKGGQDHSNRPTMPKRARPAATVIPMKRPDSAKKGGSTGTIRTKSPAKKAPELEEEPAKKDKMADAPKFTPPAPAQSENRKERKEEVASNFPVAVLYLSMSGFRALGEGFGPTRAAQFLHAVNRLIDKTVVKYHGVLETYADTGVVGLFGLPEASGAETENALRCGQELAATLSEWSRNQVLPRGGAVKFSVALHYGRVQVTAGGSADAPEVTIRGEVLSFAAAIGTAEAATNASVIASTALMDELVRVARGEDLLVEMEECAGQHVPGRADPVTLWRIQTGN